MFKWLLKLFSKKKLAEQRPSHKISIERDPLLEKAELIKRQFEAAARVIPENESIKLNSVKKFGDKVKGAGGSVSRFYQTLNAIYTDYLRPLLGVFAPLVRIISKIYRKLYNRVAYIRPSSGEGVVFSRHRSAAVIMLLVVFTFFLIYQAIFNLVPAVIRFSYDAVAINVFAYRDTLVFSKPDWVEGETGVLSVFACKRYPCVGQDDSIEFRIRDSIYLDVIRTLTKLEPHDPGQLAGAFLSEENACNIRAYGVRVKYLGWYPYIFEATCRPINESNQATVVDQMRTQAKP